MRRAGSCLVLEPKNRLEEIKPGVAAPKARVADVGSRVGLQRLQLFRQLNHGIDSALRAHTDDIRCCPMSVDGSHWFLYSMVKVKLVPLQGKVTVLPVKSDCVNIVDWQ